MAVTIGGTGDEFINFTDRGSVAPTPGAGQSRIYTKSDGLYVVDDAGNETGPFGTVTNTHGMLYLKDGSTGQGSISTTPAKLTGFATNGPSNNTTPDHTDDSITVSGAGTYEIVFQVSFTATLNTVYTFFVRVNGAESAFGCQREITATASIGSASIVGSIVLAANDVVTIYVEADGAAKTVTPSFLQLFVHEIQEA